MYKYLLLPALLLATLTGIAQNKASLKGSIIDSADRKPIELVTIAVLVVKDTTATLQAYTISDKAGEFSLRNLPVNVPLKLFISNVAFKPFRKNFSLKPGEELNLGNISLATNQLKEVNIKGERPPIVIRKDTIEFNVEAFKVKPNAVVQDLLKKLPGVQVEMNGRIMVQGKDVSKVLVDGREFFNYDYRIATQNIDLEMVDKIQVYDDRSGDPLHLKRSSQLDKVINIKFKKAVKRSTFGKFYAGTGTRDRYTGGGLFNIFRDTLQISVLGVANNLNNTGFSYGDLSTAGGFDRGGGDSFWRGGLQTGSMELGNMSTNGSNSGGFIGFNGTDRQTTASGGVNVNTDYGKKLKLNLSYFYSHTNTLSNTLYNTQRFVGDTTIYSNSKNDSYGTANRHNVSAIVEIKPNDSTEFSYRPKFAFNTNNSTYSSFTNSFSNFIPHVSDSYDGNTRQDKNVEFEHSLSYSHDLKKKGESIHLSHLFSYSPNSANSSYINNVTSYVANLTPYQQNRHTASNGYGLFVNLGAEYKYPLTKKLEFVISASTEYNRGKNYDLVYDFDQATQQYNAFLPLLSNTFMRNAWKQIASPSLSYDLTDDLTFRLRLNNEHLRLNNQFGRGLADINRRYFNILPNASIEWNELTLEYNRGFDAPDIEQLKPYTIVESPQYSESGNPDLKPTTRNTFTAGYRNFLEKLDLSISSNANYFTEYNTIFRHQTLDGVGNATSRPINMDGKYGLSLRLDLDKDIKNSDDFKLRSSTEMSAGKSRGYFEVNKETGFQHNTSYNVIQKFSLNWGDNFEFEQSYRLNGLLTTYTGVTQDMQRYTTHVVTSHTIFTWPKVFTMESTYAYVYNPRVSAGMRKSANLFNMSFAHQFLKKDRGEIKLSCYDILNQNVSQFRHTNANRITDMQWQTLNRYFLVTLQFKFNKTVSK